MSQDLAPAYQYVCSNGHYQGGPSEMTACLRANCNGTLTRIGKGAKS